jgi:hypothetical protein
MSADGDLRDAVAMIRPGDAVTARFHLDHIGDWTVTAVARELGGSSLQLGTSALTFDGTPARGLVAIESHEPAKPPVPEPQGDVLVEADGHHWFPYTDDRWVAYNTSPIDWAALVKRAHQSAISNDMKVYRPEPSPDRVEELTFRFWQAHSTPTLAELREFAASLRGGAS